VVVRALDRRGAPTSSARKAAFATGLALIAVALLSPLEHIALTSLLSLHLLQNVILADWAPPLLVLGLSPAMVAAAERRSVVRVLTSPPVALAYWLAAWYGTHIAGFYDWALRTGWALSIEHALLILGGLAFWWPLVSGRLSPPPALAYLGVGFVASSFLGLALIFSSRPFYPFYEHAPRLWGLSPIRDQNLGGIVMNGEQTLVFLLAIGWYVWRLLEDDRISGAEQSPAAH
jgi:cytochrome c oxidase assembly factor CtaG